MTGHPWTTAQGDRMLSSTVAAITSGAGPAASCGALYVRHAGRFTSPGAASAHVPPSRPLAGTDAKK
jgi:hypothetical protein